MSSWILEETGYNNSHLATSYLWLVSRTECGHQVGQSSTQPSYGHDAVPMRILSWTSTIISITNKMTIMLWADKPRRPEVPSAKCTTPKERILSKEKHDSPIALESQLKGIAWK